MATPTARNIEAYTRNDLTLIWSFTDKETGNEIDINTTYDAIRFIVYARNEDDTLYEATLVDGFSVSGNTISCVVSDAQNKKLFGGVKWFKLNVTIGTTSKTFQSGRYLVYDKDRGSQQDTGFNLIVDNTTKVVSIETSGLYAEALAYASNLNRASIQSGDAGKIERIKEDESGWENVTASEAGIATEAYVDDKTSLLQDEIDDLEANQLASTIGFETKALMDADLAHDAGTVAQVMNDATASNNGYYRKDGASGAGSWVKRASFYATTLDPADTSEAVVGKAVGDYIAESLNNIYAPTATDATYEFQFRTGIVSAEIRRSKALQYHFRVKRNVGGLWNIELRSYDGVNSFVSVANKTFYSSPEPSEPVVQTYALTPIVGKIECKISIIWQKFTAGVTIGSAGTMILGSNAFKLETANLNPNKESLNIGSYIANSLPLSGANADISFWNQTRWVRGAGTSKPGSRLLTDKDDYNNAVPGGIAISAYVPMGYYDPTGVLIFGTKIDAEHKLALWSLVGDLRGADPTYIGDAIIGNPGDWDQRIKETLIRLDGDTVHYWYKGSNGSGGIAIGYASANRTDPANTTKYGSNPILEQSDFNTKFGITDTYDINLTSVFRNPNAREGDADLYYFYGSINQAPIIKDYKQEDLIYSIWFGTGPDLQTINLQSVPIGPFSNAVNLAYDPCVWYNASTGLYVMIYADIVQLNTGRSIGGLRVATSSNPQNNWSVMEHWFVKPKVYNNNGSTIENRIYSANLIVGNTKEEWATPLSINTKYGKKLCLLISTSEGGDSSGMILLDPSVSRIPDSSVNVRVEKNGTLSVPNNTWTSVPFNKIDLEATKDFDLIWSNDETELFIRRPGIYTLNAICVFKANATGDRAIRFIKNDTATPIPLTQQRASNGVTSISTNGRIALKAGDKIEVQVYQNSGSSLDTANDWGNVKFEVSK